MGNTFITPSSVSRDASIVLDNLLVAGAVIPRDKEAVFTGSKIGDTLKVTVPPVLGDADVFTGSTSATDVTETQVDLTLEKHFYKRIDLTSKQKSLELSDFTRLVTAPVMRSFSQSINKYFIAQMQVFRAQLCGTIANRPSTVAHIAAANKALNDLLLPAGNRVMLVDTTVEASLIQLAQFTSQDHGADAPEGLRNATLGTRYGFTFVRDALLGAFDRGDVAGTVKISAEVAAGATTMVLKALTNATGTIKAGTAFVISGDTTRYVVRKDAVAVGNVQTVNVYPPSAIVQDVDDAITFEAAGYMNVAFNPAAITGAIVAPEPLSVNSAREAVNGISVRVSMDSSLISLADSIVYDVFVGARVIQPNGGALIAG